MCYEKTAARHACDDMLPAHTRHYAIRPMIFQLFLYIDHKLLLLALESYFHVFIQQRTTRGCF